jgi:hypothetical protein
LLLCCQLPVNFVKDAAGRIKHFVGCGNSSRQPSNSAEEGSQGCDAGGLKWLFNEVELLMSGAD